MSTDFHTTRFAERTARLRSSAIRDMFKVTQQPDVISFGPACRRPSFSQVMPSGKRLAGSCVCAVQPRCNTALPKAFRRCGSGWRSGLKA